MGVESDQGHPRLVFLKSTAPIPTAAEHKTHKWRRAGVQRQQSLTQPRVCRQEVLGFDSCLESREQKVATRSLTDSHGQIGMLLTLFSVHSHTHSYHSEADNAATIRAVPSACPSGRQLAANRGLRQCSRLAR